MCRRRPANPGQFQVTQVTAEGSYPYFSNANLLQMQPLSDTAMVTEAYIDT